MKQLIYIALRNVLNSKFRGIIIVGLLAVSIFVSALSYSFASGISEAVDFELETLDSSPKITIASKVAGNTIPRSTLDFIGNMDGVKGVLPQYNIGGLLEESEGLPIYSVVINGFDFENDVLIGASDYTGQDISGILLPDISFELNRNITLKDYVGSTVYFTYDYMSDGKYLSNVLACEVVGVYETAGVFEENPVYMSMDLFSGILNDYSRMDLGVQKAVIYLESADVINSSAESIGALGLEVYYESTLQNYIDSLNSIVRFGVIFVCVVLGSAVIIITQAVTTNLKKRYATIGVLKAYGYSTRLICFMVWLEIFMYCLIAVVLSIVMCFILKESINGFFELFAHSARFSLNGMTLALMASIGLLVSVISCAIPAMRCQKLNPIDVLKSN